MTDNETTTDRPTDLDETHDLISSEKVDGTNVYAFPFVARAPAKG